ncbi:HTH-type transcriptional activator CmpR [compost metagenome]
MAVNFQQLRSFHAVASDRSVTRAANRLAMTQPTLSKQIKDLEARYQVQLFSGSRPPLTLTTAGEALFEKTRCLFQTSADIEAMLGDTPPEEGGLLRIGTDSPPYAADLIAAYAREAPNLDFKVTIGNAKDTNQLLMNASVDIAVVCEPIGHNDYTYRPFYEDRLVAIAAVDAPEAESPIFDPGLLSRRVLLTREPGSRTRRAMERLLEASNIQPFRVMEVHTREMIRETVARDLGVSFMFARECPPDARIRVMELDVEPALIRVSGYIACRTERRRHPAIRRALELAECLAAP